MIVIGLSGLQRSGKDSVADILVRDYGFEKRSFAGPIKEMLRKLDPIVGAYDSDNSCGDPDCCGGPYPYIQEVRLSDAILDYPDEGGLKASEYGDEYRRLLQVLGTECIRSIDDDFWIKAARKSLTDPDGKYVFTDVRFPNEARMIFNLHGQAALATERFEGWYSHINTSDVWHVTRPGIELPDGAHVSEQWAGRMGETVEIMNNANLELLKGPVDIAVEFLNAPRYRMTVGED